ncbi:MAG: BrnA antitoxin family protein [Sphingomonas sp.]
MSDEKPLIVDDDNPEWTADDFAKARPLAEFPELAAAFAKLRGPQRAPTKKQVTLRLDQDVIAKFRATGPGWQARINAALRAAQV